MDKENYMSGFSQCKDLNKYRIKNYKLVGCREVIFLQSKINEIMNCDRNTNKYVLFTTEHLVEVHVPLYQHYHT